MNNTEFLAFVGLAPKDVYLLTVQAFQEQGRDYEKELQEIQERSDNNV